MRSTNISEEAIIFIRKLDDTKTCAAFGGTETGNFEVDLSW